MVTRRQSLRCEQLETRLTPSFTPVRPEFQVNSVTQSTQTHPAAAIDANGNFVIVFGGYDPNGPNIGWGYYARLFNADGTPRGDQILIASVDCPIVDQPAVAMGPPGDFVVARNYIPDIGGTDPEVIFARRFDSSGNAASPVIQVSDSTNVSSFQPSVALNVTGNFVVSWANNQTADFHIFVRAYDP